MKKSFVIFLSILLFLSALLLGSFILSNKSSAKPPPDPSNNPGATEMHWASINGFTAPPYIRSASHKSISVELGHILGNYIVTFPSKFKVLACTATLNSGCGKITAVPGYHWGGELNDNQVMIYTLSRDT